jgi:hypothetical protein
MEECYTEYEYKPISTFGNFTINLVVPHPQKPVIPSPLIEKDPSHPVIEPVPVRKTRIIPIDRPRRK